MEQEIVCQKGHCEDVYDPNTEIEHISDPDNIVDQIEQDLFSTMIG